MKTLALYKKRIHIVCFAMIAACLFCACAPIAAQTTTPPGQAQLAQALPGALTDAFPSDMEVDAITATVVVTEDYATFPQTQTLPPDDTLQQWFANYFAQVQPVAFCLPQERNERQTIQLHIGEATLQYYVWFDEETELFDSALFDEGNPDTCWKAPAQTDYPLMFEAKAKQGGTVFTLLPAGKTLYAYSWSNADGVNMDAELRYTGNLELWIDDTRHILFKNYGADWYADISHGYKGLSYSSVDMDCSPRLLQVVGVDAVAYSKDLLPDSEYMLLFSDSSYIKDHGEREIWRLYRVVGDTLQTYSIAPWCKEKLETTVTILDDELYIYFPKLQSYLPLDYRYLYSDADRHTLSDALAYVREHEGTEELSNRFVVDEFPLLIDYEENFMNTYSRGPGIQIMFLYSLDGVWLHDIEVYYDITTEGLAPTYVRWHERLSYSVE